MKIGFIGCGNMGKIILEALLRHQVCHSADVLVCTQSAETMKNISDEFGVLTAKSPTDLASCECVFLLVKPQQYQLINFRLSKNQVLFSCLAGISYQSLVDHFQGESVVRLMPNIGIANDQGLIGLFSPLVEIDEESLLYRIISAGGRVIPFSSESDLHAFTAVAGCGPAYVMEFAEMLMTACEKYKFPPKFSRKIITSLLASGAQGLEKNSNLSPLQMADTVTSKSGVTEAARKHLQYKNFREIFSEAVEEARKRSEELSEDK